MKRFVYRLVIFSLPIIILGITESFLPLSTFTTRSHESLLYKHPGIGMPYYPNHILNMTSVGDLCTYTDYSIKRQELWITDSIGYRNNHYTSHPDVILFGDSFLLGVGLTQDSTLSNLLAAKLEYKYSFYSIAHATFTDLLALFENGILKKPHLIIFSMGEREIPPALDLVNEQVVYRNRFFSVWLNKATRLYSVNYLMARLLNTKRKGVKSEVIDNLFFLNGRAQQSNISMLDSIANTISSYKNLCDSMDIEFLFVPSPNKETVYFDKVPLSKQPDYLFQLDNALNEAGVKTINSLGVFNSFRFNTDTFLYHLDDTHWNHNGVNLIADEIICKISHDNCIIE